MKKTSVSTSNAPSAIGPYSQAVAAGGFLYISGQIAIDPASGEMNHGSLRTQAEMAMNNLKGILESEQLSFSHVVKTTIFLAPGEDFGTVNEVYAGYFEGDYPARETVWVHSLPKDAKVEISMVAIY